MITIKDVVNAFKDSYDNKLVVIVGDLKYFSSFITLANKYGKVDCINEPTRAIVIVAIKYKKYLKLMKELQQDEGLNLKEVTRNGYIHELIEWNKEEAA